MTDDGQIALRWSPEDNTWVSVEWNAFLAFREFMTPFAPLPGVSAGIHYFVVCIFDEERTLNIIPHKYLVEPTGRIGPDNFHGWNREERDDYSRLMIARVEAPGDRERLEAIRKKAGNAIYPPKVSLYPLVRALPFPPANGSAAMSFLDAVAQEASTDAPQ
ncbi:hypothetical protein [Rhodopseudomonas sp. B29]|uniref:hypothetical protein n=1 Tax=Rhodopseudomonas sp. B29 TaxID=95607 RepID=UPI0011D25DB7|nr:hypothetical protein [Rhodopseudomonas sp. B29]